MEKNTFLVQNLKDYLCLWEKYNSQTPFVVALKEIKCKFCGSNHIIRYGRLKNKQCWWCKSCQRKFTHNEPLRGMKVSFEAIRTAVRMYFKGVPLQTIRRQLEDDYNLRPAKATINKWMTRITHEIIEKDTGIHPQVGGIWIIFETALTIAKKKFWILDVMDMQTLYLLATKLSYKRDGKDVKALLEEAKDKAKNIPSQILTGNLAEYREAVELVFGADAKQILTKTAQKTPGTKMPGNLYIPFQERRAVLHGHREEKIIRIILEGWKTQYNYFWKQDVLECKTPGQKAKITFTYSHGYIEPITF